MAIQRADNVDFSYYKVTTFAEVPATPTMQTLRLISDSFKGEKRTAVSQVLGTRQIQEIYKVGETFKGGIKGELAHTEWEFAFEGVLGGTFSAVTVTASTISFALADQSINDSGAGFGSILAGQWLLISGTVSHNGLWYVASKTSSSKLILSNGVSAAGVTLTVVIEASGSSFTVKGRTLRQGSTLNSFTFERRNKDLTTCFDVWNSWTVDKLKISLKDGELVMIEADGQGQLGDFDNTATIAGSLTAQSTNPPINSANNLMRMKEGSTILSSELVGLELEIKSNLRARLALGNLAPVGMAQGDVEVAGSMDFYFNNNVRRKLWQDHTNTTFYLILKDTGAKYTIITMQKLYYMDLANNAEKKNSDVMEKYGISAIMDGTYLQTVCIDSLS